MSMANDDNKRRNTDMVKNNDLFGLFVAKCDVLCLFSVTLDRWDDPASVLSYRAFPCCHEFSGRWVVSSGLGFHLGVP